MSNALAKLVDSDKLMEFKQMDEFLKLMNTEPPESWLKDHPLAKGVKYLPIDRVELLLTKTFQNWHVEILREGQILNSIYCTIRLHYKHPVTNEWMYQDGIAAVPIKTAKGENASNMAAILNDAIQTGLPAAESFAIKDAADKIGKIFGKDINRKDTLGFDPSYLTSDEREAAGSILQRFKDASTPEEIDDVLSSLSADEQRAYLAVAKNRNKELKDAAGTA